MAALSSVEESASTTSSVNVVLNGSVISLSNISHQENKPVNAYTTEEFNSNIANNFILHNVNDSLPAGLVVAANGDHKGLVFPLAGTDGHITLSNIGTTEDLQATAGLLSEGLVTTAAPDLLSNGPEVHNVTDPEQTHPPSELLQATETVNLEIISSQTQCPLVINPENTEIINSQQSCPIVINSQSSHLVDGQQMTCPMVINQQTSGFITTTAVLGEHTQHTKPKRTGGWPKGKKRKKEAIIKPPRAPPTAYVLFANERRPQVRQTNPELSFPDVTKLMGKEWSSLEPDVKQRYLDKTEECKRRYIIELKEYQQSSAYQDYLRTKRLKEGKHPKNPRNILTEADVIDDDSLYCKVCDVYFSSTHNRKEHFYGRQHLQNITDDFQQDLHRKEEERQKQLQYDQDTLTLSLTSTNLQRSPLDHRLSGPYSLEGMDPEPRIPCLCSSDELSIESYLHMFLEKNNDREMEFIELQKSLEETKARNECLIQSVQLLKEAETKLLQEQDDLKSIAVSLTTQIDGLKMVPHLFGLIKTEKVWHT